MILDAQGHDEESLTTRLPDAAARNWVDRFAPASTRPWLKLARLDRPAGGGGCCSYQDGKGFVSMPPWPAGRLTSR